MSQNLLDPEVLQSFRDLQTSEDPTFVKDYFSAFLEAFTKHLEALKEMIAQKDYPKLASHAHALKSTCANAGVPQIAQICGELESLGNTASLGNAEDLFQTISKEYKILKKEILSLPELKS